MPTPRHSGAAAGAAAPAVNQQGVPNGWVRGVISSVVGNFDNNYTVALENGPDIAATLVIEADVSYGTRVWVVNAGKDSIIMSLA